MYGRQSLAHDFLRALSSTQAKSSSLYVLRSCCSIMCCALCIVYCVLSMCHVIRKFIWLYGFLMRYSMLTIHAGCMHTLFRPCPLKSQHEKEPLAHRSITILGTVVWYYCTLYCRDHATYCSK